MDIFSKKLLARILPVTWTQPTLTSDGTIGGNQMAVSKVYSRTNSIYGAAYESFSPNGGQNGFYCDEYTGWMYFNIYLPVPVKLTNISFFIPRTGDSADGGAYNCHLWGGYSKNDRLEEIKNIGNVAENAGYNSSLTTNNYYQYFTLYLENGGHGHEDKVTIKNILLSGVYEDYV